jgi:uncharacterized protein (DUF2147 family)
MRRTLPKLSLLLPLFLLGAAPVTVARAADAPAGTFLGKWKTIDDATKKPKSIVEIYEADGELQGKVVQLLDPKPDDPEPKCKKCEGDLKDQAILGMRIMWHFKQDGTGGRILDPDNGKIYKCKIALTDGGKKLDVRGFIGISLLGRTQTWLREE